MKHFKYSVIVFLGQALSKKRRRKIKYVYVVLILFNSFLKDRRSVKFDGNTLKCGDFQADPVVPSAAQNRAIPAADYVTSSRINTLSIADFEF